MPNLKSSQKIVGTAARRKSRNRAARSTLKTYITKSENLISEGDLDAAKVVVTQTSSTLDKAARKKIIHRNKAARHKSRLARKLNQAAKS